MNIVIVEGCGNNITSLTNALAKLGCNFKLTKDPEELYRADKVILPGVGSAKYAMEKLRANNLVEVIPDLRQPVLGICLGMQLLFEYSEEQETKCLAILPGRVQKIPQTQALPVPHMGWNQLNVVKKNKIVSEPSYCYFIHSFYVPISTYTLATVDYGVSISAIVNYKNFYGMQFHPEKSGKVGLQLLENFVRQT